MVEQKRFALFLATSDSTFVKKTYGGYFNVFVSTFGEDGEQWDLFRVIDGEFPEEKDLDKYDGFVISGSLHDAFGDADWIVKLCSLCQKLDDMKKKVLGICFGHQTGDSFALRLNWEDSTPVLSLCPAEYSTDSREGGCSERSEKEPLPIEHSSGKEINKDDDYEDENSKKENSKEESSSWEREKNHMIWRDSTSPTQNRFLTLTITPDSLRHGRLRLPLQFMVENSMNKPGEITLLGKDGAKWLVSLLLERRGRMSLGKGWKDFAKANGLKTGDSITLEPVWEDATPVLSLLRIESSNDRAQSEFSKPSLSTEKKREGSSSGELEQRKHLPTTRRDSSSAIGNRIVILTLTPEDVRDCKLHLPSQFMRANGINKPGKITLLGRSGMKWFAYILSKDGTVALGNGWKGFCEANGVMVGESFVLELIPGEEDSNHVFKFCSNFGDQIHKC